MKCGDIVKFGDVSAEFVSMLEVMIVIPSWIFESKLVY